MYFIAFFLQAKVHRVIPLKWVRGIDYENTFNHGLNRNKKYNAFYTNNPNAFDEHGIPNVNHVPDPNAHGRAFPNEGWYSCQIRKFKGNKIFDDHTQEKICI